MKTNWIKFKTWTNLEAAYCFNECGEAVIKIISKVPRKWYSSCFNEASEYFDEVIYPKL